MKTSKIILLTFLPLFYLQFTFKNPCQYCGVYYENGDKKADAIRLDSDHAFYFKDKGRQFELAGKWQITNQQLVLRCNANFEKGEIWYTPIDRSCITVKSNSQLNGNMYENIYCKVCE